VNRAVWGARLGVALQAAALLGWAGGIAIVLAATLGAGPTLRDPFGWGTLYGAIAVAVMVGVLVVGVAGLARWQAGGGDGPITAFDVIALAFAAWVVLRGGAGELTIPLTIAYAGLVAIALAVVLAVRPGPAADAHD
jgi:hypothetical protein